MKQKKISILLSLSLILAFSGYLYYNSNNTIASSEKIISAALGVPVTISDIEIDRSAKIIRIIEFSINNPPGYTDKEAFIFPVVEMSYHSFNSQGVLISAIKIDNAKMNFEYNDHGLNLKELERLSSLSKSLNKGHKELITGVSFGKIRIQTLNFYYRMGFHSNELNKQHKGEALDPIEITFNSYNLNSSNSTRFLNQIFIDYIEAIGQQLRF